jgi:hypothetical protein
MVDESVILLPVEPVNEIWEESDEVYCKEYFNSLYFEEFENAKNLISNKLSSIVKSVPIKVSLWYNQLS